MKRSKFSLSNTKLLSGRMGHLIPIGLTEVLPGDTLQQATSLLIRTQPLLAPVMHPVHVRIHHWYVPHRLVWDDWEDFITGGSDGMDDSAFPVIRITDADIGSLADYLGVPPEIPNQMEVNALPFRAYNMIWNEWYRDQDLQAEVPIATDSGLDTETATNLLRVAWEKDYFTSARPWEQKGPAITIPLGNSAAVIGDGKALGLTSGRTMMDVSGSSNYQLSKSGIGQAAGAAGTPVNATKNATIGVSTDPALSGLRADLSSASAVTVNILREAMALQRYEEARARYGSRYTEYLRYLGIRSSDARLQRPEYLGGGKQTIQFSEVLQTAEGESPVGEMRGHGIGAMRSNRYRRFFEEHGFVISCLSVRPKTIYAQSLARHWNRRVKEDFFQKELQHIGQQEVLNKEVYAGHSQPEDVFGFQDRYDEYRRAESTVAGEFRNTILDYWHLARVFGSDPALNADFVTCNPTERIFPSQINDTLLIMARHSIQARRIVAATGHSYIF